TDRNPSKPGATETFTAQDFIRRLVSAARPVMIAGDATHPRQVLFIGDEASMRFVTTMPAHLGVSGLYDVTILLASDGADGRIDLNWSLLRGTRASLSSQNENRTELL